MAPAPITRERRRDEGASFGAVPPADPAAIIRDVFGDAGAPSDADADPDADAGLGPDAGAPPGDASLPQPPDAGAVPSCRGDASFAGHCYHASDSALGWVEARDACRAGFGDLVAIGDASEEAFVAGLLEVDVWIGANDRLGAGQFTWADGSAVTFTNWGVNQPDGFDGQDCVEKRQEQNEPWYDQPCADAHSFICERPLGEPSLQAP